MSKQPSHNEARALPAKHSKKVRHDPGYRSATVSCLRIADAPPQSRLWFARMEFLYKLAHLLPFNSQHYIKKIESIAAANTLRLDPSIKNVICKACKALLVPEVTATLAMCSGSPLLTCLSCGALRVLGRKRKAKATL